MKRTFDLMIDLSNPRQNIISMKKGDKQATDFVFTLMNKGTPFDMSDVYQATVKATKPDRTIIFATCDIDAENSKLTYTISEQATTVPGKSIYEIELVDENLAILTTFDFYVSVEANTFDELDYLSVNDLQAYRAYMLQTQRNSDETRRYVNAFRDAYGNEQVIINEQQAMLEDYNIYLNDLKAKVDAGYFNGAPGIRGEDGNNGIILEGGFILGFEIQHGNLIVYTADDSDISFTINTSGHLIASEVR